MSSGEDEDGDDESAAPDGGGPDAELLAASGRSTASDLIKAHAVSKSRNQ